MLDGDDNSDESESSESSYISLRSVEKKVIYGYLEDKSVKTV